MEKWRLSDTKNFKIFVIKKDIKKLREKIKELREDLKEELEKLEEVKKDDSLIEL